MSLAKNSGSFRDPSGFVFHENNKVYRQVNEVNKKEYKKFITSGLYEKLVSEGLLVSHKETAKKPITKDGFLVIQPEAIPFISYPYEWSFSQLKDAALLTIKIQKIALDFGMSLKDASAYNVQFLKGKPVFIDTLSFELTDGPKPWVAYKQFCQHFLAPLSLMAHTDISLSKLMRTNIDGIPLETASKLLPGKSKINFGLATHLHMHAKSQKRHAASAESKAKGKSISSNALKGIIQSLENTVKKLEWKQDSTEWGEYYTFTNYNDKSFTEKRKVIENFIEKAKPKVVWDVGANNGHFSRIASNSGIPTVAFDIDPIAVEANYHKVKEDKDELMHPMLMDLTNPSPALGWAHEERQSMEQRGPADMVFSLALIHHLAISNNLPFDSLAEYFSRISNYLVMEFVPKGDSQVDILLATREDIFPDYNEKGFEEAFKTKFKLLEKKKIKGSKRTLYLLKRK